MEIEDKGAVCVTGGTGYLASWLIMRLLQRGYSVRATVRPRPEGKRDLGFLTNLPGASERLRILEADLDNPESFDAAIEGCVGVFHVAHTIDFSGREPEETVLKRSIQATLHILKACVDSKTVRKVVYTSSQSAVVLNDTTQDVLDESSWSDIDFIRTRNYFGAPYFISKTSTERAALEFAENNGLDLVTVIPSFIHGPFIGPRIPESISMCMALIFGNKDLYGMLRNACMVHIDDVASAHIFLFEHPDAKGRYNCSSDNTTLDEMAEFLSTKYPQFSIPTPESLRDIEGEKYKGLSSKKLIRSGFEFKYGLDQMFDGAIQCCKQNGFL